MGKGSGGGWEGKRTEGVWTLEGEEHLKEENVTFLWVEEGVALLGDMGVAHHELDDACAPPSQEVGSLGSPLA